MRCALFPLLEELQADRCPFVNLPEKRRTLYSLTQHEMQNCQWLKAAAGSTDRVYRVDAG
jgi:hypothetical protein